MDARIRLIVCVRYLLTVRQYTVYLCLCVYVAVLRYVKLAFAYTYVSAIDKLSVHVLCFLLLTW